MCVYWRASEYLPLVLGHEYISLEPCRVLYCLFLQILLVNIYWAFNMVRGQFGSAGMQQREACEWGPYSLLTGPWFHPGGS
jgi:hypothetical protein